MKRLNGWRLGLIGAAAVVAALIGGLMPSAQVSAQDETVSIGSLTMAVGEQGSVDLRALNIDPPGLGAWTIDIVYDPAVVSVVDCTPVAPGGVCNPSFNAITIRDVGAYATGHEGDTTLAIITFQCERRGSSALTLSLEMFADTTVGDPQPITAAVEDGAVTCTPGGEPPASVEICHKLGTRAEKTLEIPEPAVAGHLRHGDTLGAC